MPNEQEDESLGTEQLPQTELDVVPGGREKSASDAEDSHDTDSTDSDKLRATQPSEEQNRQD